MKRKVEILLGEIEKSLSHLNPKRIDPTFNVITYLDGCFVDLWIMCYKDKYQLRIGRSDKLCILQNPFSITLEKCVKFVSDWLETNRSDIEYEKSTRKLWDDVKSHLMNDFGMDSEEASELVSRYMPKYRSKGIDVLNIDPSDIAASFADSL